MKKTEKIKLTDMTFIMPVRFDSIIRLENAIAVIDFLYKNFDTNIFVLEASPQSSSIFKSVAKNKIQYYHLEDHDIIFHKTKYINVLTQKINTSFMSIWDADVIADKNQIVDALEMLRINEADISYPYDGRFFDTSDVIRSLYIAQRNIKILHNYIHYMHLIYGNKMLGGAVFMNTEKYLQAGMDNEDFYGWGNEDYERQYRLNILEYKTYRSKGPIYHLSHPRDMNGMFRSEKQHKWTGNYLQNIMNSSKDEIFQ
jgi:hypothetical protein